jgi:hypothetical protein
MNASQMEQHDAIPEPQIPFAEGHENRRWWIAVGAGVLVGLPIGWALSYGAALFAMLGLFFFMLFGLVVGAVMFRVAQPIQPIRPWRLRVGTAIAVLTTFGISMAVECYDFPRDVAHLTVKRFPRRPSGMPPDEIKISAERWTRQYLAEAYPPGGAIGYMRWKLTNDRLEVELTEVDHRRTIRFHDNGAWWMIRVVFSIALLWFAIFAVVRPLAKPPKPKRVPRKPRQPEAAPPPVNATAP